MRSPECALLCWNVLFGSLEPVQLPRVYPCERNEKGSVDYNEEDAGRQAGRTAAFNPPRRKIMVNIIPL